MLIEEIEGINDRDLKTENVSAHPDQEIDPNVNEIDEIKNEVNEKKRNQNFEMEKLKLKKNHLTVIIFNI